MRDPFMWSFAVGRLSGISIRIHILFPIVVIGLIWREFRDKEPPAAWISMAVLMGILVFSVLVHEFGHCFMARLVGGEATEIMIWPLGGLASVDVPHSPRANFLTAAAGPLANLVLLTLAGLLLIFAFDPAWQPPINPFTWYPYSGWNPNNPGSFGEIGKVPLFLWHPTADKTFEYVDHFHSAVILSQIFYINWILFLVNVALAGFPFDAGRMLQSALWPYAGYRQATIYAVFSGFFIMFAMLIACIVRNEMMLGILAIFIYTACKQQWFLLEHGGDDSLFGYDFSQGYTSLEKEPVPPARPKQPNFFQRWRQRRAARKLLREQQRQEEEANRMDQLLEKIQRSGKESLTDEELRFLNKVANRLRNRP